ncbi:G-type lectin S-receptor-like serine/threonine-protein kinase [Pyrus ussuriensis x Pyrus communis]|uniref:G-type lectin S-receptor-like serine/threonine-protein kinase n=1 Tax=Pyrus ussuriensis x Pyrus communis TaxID=2448454 RepID=A0A5N5IBD7_9ROSA|nr:G-type lectin S-receptor-like serine/threonine-protein kinase [Pyrus ussuriensis x Pyrus communis]
MQFTKKFCGPSATDRVFLLNFRTESAFSAMNSPMFFLFFLSLLLTQHYCAEVYNITSLQPLAQGQTLVSPSHIFELGFFNTSENKYVGIWHKNILPRTGKSLLQLSDALASLAMNNGNLELVDGKQKSTWSINIQESSNSSAAVLLETGNFIVADDIGHHLWKSFDCPDDTLLPEMALRFDSENWSINREAPKNPCDYYGTCGPFGACRASDSLTTPICKCLKGFVLESLEEWSKGNMTGGCVRKTKLFCGGNASQPVASRGKEDGFKKIEMVNPPDFHEYILNMDPRGCRTQCQNNCSCLAYAYVNNIGCLIWSKDLIDIQQFSTGGVDLFIRLADAEFVRFELNGKTENSRDALQELIRKHDPSELIIYDFDSILIATSNFSINNKLGGGGFGPVYKFKNEVMLISKLQHKNLVRIMGCCIKDDEKLLIYEFMPNRSLDILLFDAMRRAVLDWAKRFNIIQGVINRDLKVNNILLDENKNPKILDFGLAALFKGLGLNLLVQWLCLQSMPWTGYFLKNLMSITFGVLLLEIIANRKNTSSFYKAQELCKFLYAKTQYSRQIVTWTLWNEGKGLDFVDEVLADSYLASEVTRCMHIGLLYVQNNAADRPTIADVVFMLRRDRSISDLQPNHNHVWSANEAIISHISKDDGKREPAQLAEVPKQIYKSKSEQYLELSK